VIVAGGGTAGHIEPAMAVADALRRLDPGIRITALGTERGLETRLVPERGYPLELVPPVPLPRKPTADL
jgi:UDP-N-acetylglucosamine--N-acetylmuramyl-(pentapeptide) pyrophosphoryl-undecaprenol N-acetylglucosamine transferase